MCAHYRFAQAKKCSNEGRALMQLDFQQFRTQIERTSKIRYELNCDVEVVCKYMYIMILHT